MAHLYTEFSCSLCLPIRTSIKSMKISRCHPHVFVLFVVFYNGGECNGVGFHLERVCNVNHMYATNLRGFIRLGLLDQSKCFIVVTAGVH